MGLFDMFKKKDCEICGKEVGLLGYKKLEDGEICKDCVKLLSPWFEDRRHATVQQIKEQLAYRAQNEKELKSFHVSRVIGDYEKIHIEEVNGVPTRFFVTQFGEGVEDNPDIICFQDVVSCVLDLDVYDEELKQKDAEGNRVSYNPPRYQHHYNFIIRMEIRNNPYFDDIYFTVNSGVVTLESVGTMSGIGGAALSGFLKGAGIGTQAESYTNSRERRRYSEYQMMCDKIIQAVEDGKRGQAAVSAVPEAPVVEQPVQVGPKFCPNCGAPAEGGKFCQSCGSKLG